MRMEPSVTIQLTCVAWLLVGSTTKYFSALFDSAPILLNWTSRPLVATAAILELIICAIYLTRVGPTVARVLLICVFSTFLLVHLAVIMGIFGSCSCFGSHSLPSWLMICINGCCALVFLISTTPSRIQRHETRLICVAVIVLVAVPLWTVAAYRSPKIQASGNSTPDPVAIVASLLPEIRRDRWRLVYYSPVCPHCQDEMPRLVTRAQGDDGVTVRWVFINIDIDASDSDLTIGALPPYVKKLHVPSLSSLSTPIIVMLDGGRIISTTRSAD